MNSITLIADELGRNIVYNGCSNASLNLTLVKGPWPIVTIPATVAFVIQFAICLSIIVFFLKTKELRQDMTARFVINLLAVELWQTLTLTWELSLWTPVTTESQWQWCRAAHFLWMGAFTAEPWASLLLCADLLDKLTNPLSRKVTACSAKVMILVSWIVPLVFVIIPAVGLGSVKNNYNRSLWCIGCRNLIQLEHVNPTKPMMIYYDIHYAIGVFLPTAVSFFFYIAIFKIAYREGAKARRRSVIARRFRTSQTWANGNNQEQHRTGTLASTTSTTTLQRDRRMSSPSCWEQRCGFGFLKIRGFKTLMTVLVSDIFLRAPLLIYVLVCQHDGLQHYQLSISFAVYCVGLIDGFVNVLLLSNWVRLARRNAVRRRHTRVDLATRRERADGSPQTMQSTVSP